MSTKYLCFGLLYNTLSPKVTLVGRGRWPFFSPKEQERRVSRLHLSFSLR